MVIIKLDQRQFGGSAVLCKSLWWSILIVWLSNGVDVVKKI